MSSAPAIRAYGDRALLVELPDNEAAQVVAVAARAHWQDQLAEVIPGHRTVLLVWKRDAADLGAATSFLEQCVLAANCSPNDTSAPVTTEMIKIPVAYDGADLQAVAEKLEITASEVVELHSAATYTVAFMGFMPGFPYLIGAASQLHLPRLNTPRTEVPVGSVAVAAGYCGIYPRVAPSGWNLLGRTEVELFNPERESPALLTPGTRLRFEPV